MSSSAIANSTTTLTVEVKGLRNFQGQVCITVYADNKAFPKDVAKSVQSQCIKITDAQMQATFENLPLGNYAVCVLHDENYDTILNCNFLGIPVEGFGFSRNPPIRFGAPKFEDAVFKVTQPRTTIQVKLNYLFG